MISFAAAAEIAAKSSSGASIVKTGTRTGATTKIGESNWPRGYCEVPQGCTRLTWQPCYEGKALIISVYRPEFCATGN